MGQSESNIINRDHGTPMDPLINKQSIQSEEASSRIMRRFGGDPTLNHGKLAAGHEPEPPWQITFRFRDIEKVLVIELPKNLSYQTFKDEFKKLIKIPTEYNFSFTCIEENSGSNEMKPEIENPMSQTAIQQEIPIEKDIDATKFNRNVRELIVCIKYSNGAKLDPIEVKLLCINGQFLEVFSIKTYSFLPLRFVIPTKFEDKTKIRLFRQSDSSLGDPLELHKSLDDYGLNLSMSLCNLVVYLPTAEDNIRVAIHYKENIKVYDADKFMRISELIEIVNVHFKINSLLCAQESGLKLNEGFTLAMLAKKKQTLSFMAVDFEEYYKNYNIETKIPSFMQGGNFKAAAPITRKDDNPLEEPD